VERLWRGDADEQPEKSEPSEQLEDAEERERRAYWELLEADAADVEEPIDWGDEEPESNDAPAAFDQTIWDRLPAYDARREIKTRGVVVSADGVDMDLLSGTKGASAHLGEYRGTGMNGRVRSHVEAHAGAVMRIEGWLEATLYLNQVPCKERLGCERGLPRFVPPGAKLTIYAPGYVRVVRGLPEDQR
jgi:hypothetical protein